MILSNGADFKPKALYDRKDKHGVPVFVPETERPFLEEVRGYRKIPDGTAPSFKWAWREPGRGLLSVPEPSGLRRGEMWHTGCHKRVFWKYLPSSPPSVSAVV